MANSSAIICDMFGSNCDLGTEINVLFLLHFLFYMPISQSFHVKIDPQAPLAPKESNIFYSVFHIDWMIFYQPL